MSNAPHLADEPRLRETPAARPRGNGTAWFPWCVAICLTVLACSTYQQATIQKRLLVGGRELERIVAESRMVSGDTNAQLRLLRQLEAATFRMDEKLARIGQVNAAIRAELAGLESTAEAVYRSVITMETQAGRSRALLDEVARESEALYGTLLQSQEVGAQLTDHLGRLVEAQEAINADLREMTEKTKFIDRIGRGDGP